MFDRSKKSVVTSPAPQPKTKERALTIKKTHEEALTRLKLNTLSIVIWIRSDPPQPNDFHWGYYFHKNHQGGFNITWKSWVADGYPITERPAACSNLIPLRSHSDRKRPADEANPAWPCHEIPRWRRQFNSRGDLQGVGDDYPTKIDPTGDSSMQQLWQIAAGVHGIWKPI